MMWFLTRNNHFPFNFCNYLRIIILLLIAASLVGAAVLFALFLWLISKKISAANDNNLDPIINDKTDKEVSTNRIVSYLSLLSQDKTCMVRRPDLLFQKR